MTRPDHSEFFEGDLSEEEEQAYLQAHPDLLAELQLEMLVDGELSSDEADRVRGLLAESPELQKRLDELIMLDAVASLAQPPHEEPSAEPKYNKGSGRLWQVLPLMAAAAGVLLAVSMIDSGQRVPDGGLVVELLAPEGRVRAKTAVVGDTVRLVGPAGDLRPTLRLYEEAQGVVMECPGQFGCEVSDGNVSAMYTFGTPGTYYALWVVSKEPLPPSRGSIEEDAPVVDEHQLKHELETIEVRTTN